MKVVTIQTTIQTIFGILDEDGDISQKQPVSLELQKLNQESFNEALTQLLTAKEKIKENLK